jgi:hypothetical protein
MSRCQSIVTALLAWMSILPLLAVGAVLVCKPSLLLHPDENDENNDSNNDPLEENDQYSFLILLAGGVLLGQAIMHLFLLLPLTGDACCCCCCCFYASSYAIGIRPFSVYVSRMATLSTVWTSLVLLVLTFWTLHQQLQREHRQDDNHNSTILADLNSNGNHHHKDKGHDHSEDDDHQHSYYGWSNDTYVVLMTASATSLALSTLSLVVSLLPCSSSRIVAANRVNHQAQDDNDQEATALRQPLLQTSPRRPGDGAARPRRVEGV